ncbi:MAG: serine/threonine protein kinase [Candidatus Cloacimonadaceae bacterium]|nr:serine/threonine protein kinase [Methanosarcina sp.]
MSSNTIELNHYKIISELGKGGMGTVYLAKDSFLDRSVAIKELNPLLTSDADLIARFRNEARLQAKLSHTNIVGLYSFFEQNERHYIVMEYAEGKTLKEIIKQTGPIPEKRAIAILRQILSALEYAHGMGIIHRDIKPSNIILDAQDSVKVLDFGIARVMGERGLTLTGQQLGTVGYMSPEQVKAEKDIDEKTDIYSLGITFFEMLSGRMPYDLDSLSDYEVMDNIVKTPLPDPRDYYPHISDNAVNVLKRMAEKDRSLRYHDAKQAADNLDKEQVFSSDTKNVLQRDTIKDDASKTVAAKVKQINEPEDNIDYESMAKSLNKKSIITLILSVVFWCGTIGLAFLYNWKKGRVALLSLFSVIPFSWSYFILSSTRELFKEKKYKDIYDVLPRLNVIFNIFLVIGSALILLLVFLK